MKKTNFFMVMALAAFFAFGTTAIAAEKASQDFNQQKVHASQAQMQKDQHKTMNKADLKAGKMYKDDWGKPAAKGNNQAEENSLKNIELETARQMFQGKMKDPFVRGE